jgi:hypothetical protein
MAFPPQQKSEITVGIQSTPPTPGAAAAPPAPPKPRTVEDYVRETARKYKVDEDLALSIIEVESSGRHTRADGSIVQPQTATGQKAQGLFQLLPSTAAGECGVTDPSNVFQNIECGVKYLRQGIDRAPSGGPISTRDVARYYHGGPNQAQWGPITDRYANDVLAALERRDVARRATATTPTTPGSTTTPTTPTAPPTPPGWLSKFASEASRGVRDVASMVGTANQAVGQGIVNAVRDPAQAARSLRDANRSLGQSIVTAVEHPVDTASALYDRFFNTQVEKVQEAWQAGDYAKAALEAKNIPLNVVGMGTRMGEAEEFGRQGEYAKMLGATADIGASIAAPELGTQYAQRVGRVVPRLFKPRLGPGDARAVQLGLAADVPLSASTRSGSGFAKTAEYVAQSTPIGNVISQIQGRQMMRRMNALGTRLAGGVHPTPISGAEAGRSALTALTAERDVLLSETNTLYDALRQHAADPAYTRAVQTGTRPAPFMPAGAPPIPVIESLQLPVDMRPLKTTLQSARDDLARRRLFLNPAEERSLNLMDHFVNGPDYAPLAQVERDLGSLKAITRQAEPGTRNVHQGTAARGVQVLQGEIDAAAANAGPDVIDALREARKTRAAQSATQEVLDRLEGTHAEPVEAFRRLTSAGNLEFLKTVAQHAPGEVPKIGRALLEDLFTKARGLPGADNWGKMESLANTWEQLHPEIKQLLYGPNAADLDSFFLLGRRIAQSPNPSGTGRAVVAATMLNGIWAAPLATAESSAAFGVLSAALNTPGGARLLTEGLTIPEGTARAAGWTAAIARMTAGATGAGATPPPAPPR